MAALAFPAFLVVNEARGEGLTFNSLAAGRQTERLFSALANGDYNALDDRLVISHIAPDYLPEYMREKMGELEKNGLQIVSMRANAPSFTKENGAVMGKVGIRAACGGEEYSLTLVVLGLGRYAVGHDGYAGGGAGGVWPL